MEDEFLRIWVGVHPGELDDQRVLALHNEVHGLLGTIRSERWKRLKDSGIPRNQIDLVDLGYSPAIGWTDPKGLAALFFLHGLLVDRVFPQRRFNHSSDLMMPSDMSAEVCEGCEALTPLFLNGQHTHLLGTKRGWPPPWVDIPQRIADLKDLQYRWAMEGNEKWLEQTYTRYGEWPGGNGSGVRSDPATVTPEDVEKFLAHRAAYKAGKG
jgi:hypothetical protein